MNIPKVSTDLLSPVSLMLGRGAPTVSRAEVQEFTGSVPRLLGSHLLLLLSRVDVLLLLLEGPGSVHDVLVVDGGRAQQVVAISGALDVGKSAQSTQPVIDTRRSYQLTIIRSIANA